MKKILVAWLWALYLIWNVFAVNNFISNHTEKFSIKDFEWGNINNISNNDIQNMVNFFNSLEDELN